MAASAVGDFQNLVIAIAARCGHRNGIADAFGNQRLGQWRGNGEQRAFDIGLVHADDLVSDLFLGILVEQQDVGAEFDGVAGQRGRVDDFGGGGDFLQLGDPALDEGLALARGMVFRVLRKIAMGTGLGDGANDGGAVPGLSRSAALLQARSGQGRSWEISATWSPRPKSLAGGVEVKNTSAAPRGPNGAIRGRRARKVGESTTEAAQLQDCPKSGLQWRGRWRAPRQSW